MTLSQGTDLRARMVLGKVLTGAASPDWALPVLVAAALGGPVFGVLVAARATRDRPRGPARRHPERAPLGTATDGLVRLAVAASAILLLLGLLGVVLGAATSAPGRGETLARLRTLGLRPAQARRVAVGELLPPIVVDTLVGAASGVLLGRFTLGPLPLGRLTGQVGEPAAAVPWWGTGVLVLAFVLAGLVVVRVESALRSRARLGDVLRVGSAGTRPRFPVSIKDRVVTRQVCWTARRAAIL